MNQSKSPCVSDGITVDGGGEQEQGVQRASRATPSVLPNLAAFCSRLQGLPRSSCYKAGVRDDRLLLLLGFTFQLLLDARPRITTYIHDMTSLSYYHKNQYNNRSRKESVSLPVIGEEVVSKPIKSNSVKARRRLGVSDLRIPHLHPRATAVQGDLIDWSLTLPGSLETFDFPHPPSRSSLESSECSGSGSSSGSDGESLSSAPTTPAASPTKESRPRVARCKTIKPLTIKKRGVSPLPPQEDSLDSEQDDEYYAAHARLFVTLSPALPPSFPRRDSIMFPPASSAPYRASVRRSRALSITARALPPPIVTSIASCRSSTLPIRAPPRTPVPTDAQSGDYGALLSALTSPLLAGLPSTPFLSPAPASRSPSPLPSLSPSLSVSGSSCASRLSPRPPPAEVPVDLSADDWEGWDDTEDDAFSPLPTTLAVPVPVPTRVAFSDTPPPSLPDSHSADDDDLPSPITYAAPEDVEPEERVFVRAASTTPFSARRESDASSAGAPALRSRWSVASLASLRAGAGAGHRFPLLPRRFPFAFNL
ncbi:hypothetical protein B0H15DRAFT_158473 [Mycena belliarum]|uniref:Uncharacterized protein n=1 Tax=Mycena belliarum TaxID=1033014 RepID=A0AAD6U8Y3_9AGAR|nr:hypothetical protein B0H15DRAFT_158473 [Mycena belliae]